MRTLDWFALPSGARRPRVMPANAGIQNATTLAEFRLLATPASGKPCAAASGPRFRGYDRRAHPNAVLFVSCWRSEAIESNLSPAYLIRYGLRGWLRSSGLLSPSQADFQAFLHADGLATSRGFEPRHLQIRNLALYPILATRPISRDDGGRSPVLLVRAEVLTALGSSHDGSGSRARPALRAGQQRAALAWMAQPE